MRLATRIWILAAIVWLFGLGLCPMQAFASKSRMTASLGPFARIAYDGQTQPSIAYDGSSLPSSDYDSASSRITNESENRRAGSTGVFGHFAKFLAAEETLATRLANKAQSLSAAERPNTVAVIQTQSGHIVVGQNMGSVVNEEVQGVLNELPGNQFGGQCAEVNAISRALNKGLDLTGARISVSNVRGPLSTSGIHGTAKDPCSVCSLLIQQYGLKYVQ